VRGSALQQLDLDLTNAAADLEHCCTLEPTRLEKFDHALRRLIKPSLPVASRYAAGKPRREELVTTARIATARHNTKLRTCFA
jgi:hypothetical protein